MKNYEILRNIYENSEILRNNLKNKLKKYTPCGVFFPKNLFLQFKKKQGTHDFFILLIFYFDFL